MYYKVIKNGRVIDVLSHLTFLRYQKKHDIMISCDESEAQAILSSDENNIWHVSYMPNIPSNNYDTVELEEIDKYEFEQLKVLNLKTPEEIIDSYTNILINGNGYDIFNSSIMRLSNNTEDKLKNNMMRENVFSHEDGGYVLRIFPQN